MRTFENFSGTAAKALGVARGRSEPSVARHPSSAANDRSIAIGPWVLSAKSRVLADETGAHVVLTRKEAELLLLIHGSGEAGLPKETLLEEIWGYNPACVTHTVETHIYRLRKKLDCLSSSHLELVTSKLGYYHLERRSSASGDLFRERSASSG